jgi:hypothetical protein
VLARGSATSGVDLNAICELVDDAIELLKDQLFFEFLIIASSSPAVVPGGGGIMVMILVGSGPPWLGLDLLLRASREGVASLAPFRCLCRAVIAEIQAASASWPHSLRGAPVERKPTTSSPVLKSPSALAACELFVCPVAPGIGPTAFGRLGA